MVNEQLKKPLLGTSLQDLQKWASVNGFTDVIAWKIARWFYPRGISDFPKMKDVSMETRKRLTDSFIPGIFAYSERRLSEDGSVKYIFQTEDGRSIEAVYLPEGGRHTLCLSIQSGCRMGCRFCRTGSLGFHGNLEVHHILNQLYSIEEKRLINHIVFMGMGEPLDNYKNLLKSIEILTAEWGFAIAYKHIAVSTVGIQPGLSHFLMNSRCNLALSLHSPFEEERKNLIPAEKLYPFKDLLSEMKNFKPVRKRRISVQYTLIGGVNDSDRHLEELISLLRNSNIRLNLICFHPFESCDFRPPAKETVNHFISTLSDAGIHATLRKSRGEDIGAACGLLGNINQNK